MSPDEYEQLLHDAEVKLSRLKALYEQYFQGIEKLEPNVPRKDLDRSLELLKKQQPRNTALRFRLNMLSARYGTYQTYWQRIARQIEEGTFRRDVIKAQQRRHDQGGRRDNGEKAYELDLEIEIEEPEKRPSVDESNVDAILGSLAPAKSDPAPAPRRVLSPFAMAGAAPGARNSATPPQPSPPKVAATFAKPIATLFAKPVATPPKPVEAKPVEVPKPQVAVPSPHSPAQASPPRPPAPPVAAPKPVPPQAPMQAPADALDAARMRRIYDSYVDAKKKNNERTDVKYESLEQSVKQMMPKLREKHGNKAIDFEVVITNGKVGLKPKVG